MSDNDADFTVMMPETGKWEQRGAVKYNMYSYPAVCERGEILSPCTSCGILVLYLSSYCHPKTLAHYLAKVSDYLIELLIPYLQNTNT